MWFVLLVMKKQFVSGGTPTAAEGPVPLHDFNPHGAVVEAKAEPESDDLHAPGEVNCQVNLKPAQDRYRRSL